MADSAEYQTLLNKQSETRSEYTACENRIGEYDYLLGRLRPVKQTLQEQKSNFSSIKKSDKNIINEKYAWKGVNYNDFKSSGDELEQVNNDYYKNTLDYLLDSINDEITRIENKRMQEKSLLGYLGSALNSIANEIENFLN